MYGIVHLKIYRAARCFGCAKPKRLKEEVKFMKKIIALSLLVLIMMVTCVHTVAEDTEWTCPSCGATVVGNFCSKCGEKRPDDTLWICPNCGKECTDAFCPNCGMKRDETADAGNENDGKLRLDLNISFEKNAYFSTYDVKLLVDDVWVTTMHHGIDYAGTIYVTPGKHIIVFQEDRSSYPSKGSTIININDSTLYRCEIHAKMDTVQITGERTETISDDREAPDDIDVIRVDGDLALRVSIEFRKNGMFSQYNVDMYCDDMFIATLPHGKNYEGMLLVSKGVHMISFYKSRSKSVRGTCSFKVEKDATFSCKIEAERNKVEVSKDKLTY